MPLLSAPTENQISSDDPKLNGNPIGIRTDQTANSDVELSPVKPLDRFFRSQVFGHLRQIREASLEVLDARGNAHFGDGKSDVKGMIEVRDPRFYRAAALGGGLGVAEGYLRGDWETPDLTSTLRVLARNLGRLEEVERGQARLLKSLQRFTSVLRRNTLSGSRRNIAAHYDLSNEFFALMLDPTMTYSSGIFSTPRASLEDASRKKYDRICRELDLRPADRVIEIGTGWGGFAEHAARHYGCRIDTTTISNAQFQYAKQRITAAGLEDRITIMNKDYRELRGKYDKLVSIEMIEAVGEKYLPTFFECCSALLKSGGQMALQAIHLPDQRFDRYRRSVDFIQRYIFPGGFLPSLGTIVQSVAKRTPLRIVDMADFGLDYAITLARWREQFWHNIEDVRVLGFTDRFIRTWHYYLSYCEAGFAEKQIGVAQFKLAK